VRTSAAGPEPHAIISAEIDLGSFSPGAEMPSLIVKPDLAESFEFIATNESWVRLIDLHR
jgi:hypothetical protein